VHLGPGAFFRGFNAVWTDEAMAAAGGDWGILAVSLQSATARDQLVPQGGVFTSVELGPEGRTRRIIGSVAGVMLAPEEPGAVVAAMADPAVRIVSLTVTEKGYCHSPSTGRLNPDHPDILHDLGHPGLTRSAPGMIVAALARRRAAGVQPFTVLSCDNLPSNGRLVRGIVLELAALTEPGLADWIAAEGRFPATMVDRITPATTPDDIARLEVEAGYHDPACVQHEPFRQWVIEDDFVDGARPAWDRVGVQMVRNVDRHEVMKLRCLNGTHSTLAYLGYLSGYQTIAETVGDPVFAALCERLWRDEIIPTVPVPEGEDLGAYVAALMVRYRNPTIRHRTWQIAMDGSQKLQQRILGTVRDNLAAGRVPGGLCLAVAGWMRYAGGVDEAGGPIEVKDPLAARLRAASDSAGDPAGKVAALLAVEAVFDPVLAADLRFRGAVTAAYGRLVAQGARASVAEMVA
jgi:fructuronate reductase